MKKLLLLTALMALAACATSGGGPRTDWACDGGSAFSVRMNGRGAAEVFAAGRTYTLPPSGSGYSDGQVRYAPQGGQASLTGAFGGPFENCRRG